jgi:flagellar hook-associated protein 2
MAINTIRMTGLTSGLDTEALVSAITATSKYKVDYEKQNKQLLELKQEAWKDMNSKIYTFYTKTLNDFKFRTTYGKTDTTNSNPNAVAIDPSVNIPTGTHTIDVTQVAKVATINTQAISGTRTTKLNEIDITSGSFSFTVNGKTATIEIGTPPVDPENNKPTAPNYKKILAEDATIQQFEAAMKEVMTAAGIKDANFSFDTNTNAFFISTKNTGATQNIELSGEWNKLGVVGPLVDQGEDAIYSYNGGALLTSATNAVTINGLRATIIGETNGTSATITAVKNIEGTVAVAKAFVEEYNKLLEEINALIDAPSARNYRPLTDEQKETMSDSDIKLWEERVKASILRKDSVLTTIASDMRSIVGNSGLFKLGISTGQDWKEKGKLYLDEEKLTKMIQEDANSFDDIFKEVGTKLYDNIRDKLRGTVDKSSNFLFADKVLTKEIKSSEDRISVLEGRLVKQEELYYAKFTAMEKMLSQLNSQSSWLTSQF